MADPFVISVPYTADQITALRANIASGVTRVSYGDKSVENRSLADLRLLLATMEAEVYGVGRRRTILMTSPWGKGL